MAKRISRRSFVAAGAAIAGTGGMSFPFAVQAQATAGPKPAITIRVDREFDSLDPSFRRGPVEGNVMRAIYQRLMTYKPGVAELELEAAAEIKQTSPTTIDFRLKPGHMFSDGFGEMTAEDVKFSFEAALCWRSRAPTCSTW